MLLIASLLSVCSYGQQNHFRHFGLESGLPQSQVFDVMQDSRGFIWVATRGGGVARFDGLEFKTYNTKNGLINNFVNCIFEDNSGDLWIGTKTGLSRFNGLEFKNYSVSPKGDVRVFCVEQVDSTILAGTSAGLYLINGTGTNRVEGLDEGANFYVLSIVRFADKVLVGTNRGLYKLDAVTWRVEKKYTVNQGLPDNYIQSMAVDSQGVWVATYGRGIRFFDGTEISDPWLPVPSNTVCYDMLVTSDRKLWMATQSNGTYVFDLDKKTTDHYSISTGLANNHVRSITQDSWGNVWLGTSGGGLNEFAGQQFAHMTLKDGLTDNYVYAICQDYAGAMWVGVGRRGVDRKDSNGFVNYALDSGFANVKVKAIAQSADSTLWFGTEGAGLAYRRDSVFHWITVKQGLCGNYVKDIECTADGRIWVATLDGGISEIIPQGRKFRFKNYRYLTQLPSNRVHALHADQEGKMWFGTENKGLGYISDGKVKMVVGDDQINYHNIRAIRRRGAFVWFATSGGLMRYEVQTGELSDPVQDQLRSSNIYLLEFDKQGNLYAGHERGLEKMKLNETGDVIEVEFYGVSEGFSGIETCQNASACDADGNMWFGTINGLTRYNPDVKNLRIGAPRVWLDNIDLFYEKLSPGSFNYQPSSWGRLDVKPVFPHHQNHLSFSFTGIDLNSPTRLKYSWKLDGFDEEWVKPTQKRDAIYSNLPPGEYVLRYKTVSAEGVESPEHQWPFVVEAPFWQTWWFRLLTWLVPAIILILGITLYIRRIKLRESREREKLIIEKELVELEQKALRLQMNPHFLFNALNSIQSLVALENHQDARKYLQKFAKLMRLTLRNSRVETIPLSDEIMTLSNYLELEQLTRKPAFRFSIEVGEGIDAEDTYIPPMMLQPFVENAIKHGVPDLGADGEILVRFDLEGDRLICTISDNGIGREAAEERVKGKSKTHESAAIQVITDRLRILNQSHPGNSLEIEDLEQGTRVIVTLIIG